MNSEAIVVRNEKLARELLTGSKEARDEMIVINRPLVKITIDRFLRANPNYRQAKADLMGIGFIALVKAVDRLAKVMDLTKSVRNYLITAIRYHLVSEMRRQKAYYKTHCHVPSYDSLPETLLAAEDRTQERAEMLEVLVSVCETDLERELLRLYLDHCTPSKMVEVTGLPKPAIYRALRKIRVKAKNKWRE